MSNMSYCRWENTASDMRDCVNAQAEGFNPNADDVSSHEKEGYYDCLRMAARMLQQAEGDDLDEIGIDLGRLDECII